jgi:hypothetical protein
MDRIHKTLVRFEKRMMPGIQMDPYEKGAYENGAYANGAYEN